MAPSRLAITRILLLVALAVPAVVSIKWAHVSLAASPSRAAAHTNPKSLVLHAADVPSSLGSDYSDTGSSVSNSQAASAEHISKSTITNHGRISGYQTVLVRRKIPPLTITDSVDLYRTVAGAHWQYGKFTSVFKVPSDATKVSLPGIGDELRAYKGNGPSEGPITPSAGHIYFRRGLYLGRIDIVDPDPLKTSDMLKLAQILDGRLKRAR